MSRDPRNPGDVDDAAELLTAYVDGVAELAPDERHRIEARLSSDPEVRTEATAVHALLDRLRALPPAGDGGDEPDWAAMERSIRSAVAAEPVRPWWRSWRWLVPAMTCVTAAALLFVVLPRTPAVAPERRPIIEPAPAPTVLETSGGDSSVALWLDGAVLDIDLSGPGLTDVTAALGGLGGPGGPGDVMAGDTESPQTDVADEGGLLPATDLAWVDGLDDAALDRAEHWLAGNKG